MNPAKSGFKIDPVCRYLGWTYRIGEDISRSDWLDWRNDVLSGRTCNQDYSDVKRLDDVEETRDPLDPTKNDLKLWGQAWFDQGVDTYHQVRKLDGL